MRSIVSRLASILGSESVVAPEALPTSWRTRLEGVFAPSAPLPCLVRPSSVEALAEVVRCATQDNWRLLPCGGGLHLRWGKPSPSVDLLLSTALLNHSIEHAQGDLTLTVQAGMTLEKIRSQLQPYGQFLPLQSSYGEASTVGGIVATADSGPLRHRYGGVRDLLLGLEFVRADGQRSKAGGRVVKNVAGYDLMKLFTGSYGSLGIITQLTFRLYPTPDTSGTIVLWGEASSIATVHQTLQASSLTPVAVELLSSQLLRALVPDAASESSRSSPPPMALAVQFASLEDAVHLQLDQVQTWGKTHQLQSLILEDTTIPGNPAQTEQAQFWQALQQRRTSLESGSVFREDQRILCKIAVLPDRASEVLTYLDTLHHLAEGTIAWGAIQGGSGLGWVELQPIKLRFPVVEALRRYCQDRSGFLTLLEGPVSLKQQMEVWGYQGNALSLMAKIKEAFDPQHLLSPERFVVG